MKELSENLYRRLTLSKYLFRQARLVLQYSEPYSRGLATSLLQDSVEIFLRVLGEQYKIKIQGRGDFHQLLDRVGKQIGSVGEHSAAIKRLNTARIGFKHEGLDVSAIDVKTFQSNVEAFLSEVCREALKVDFETLSLVAAIGHCRTRNWLKKARKALLADSYTTSVAHSAAAMVIYLNHWNILLGERTDPADYIDSDSSEVYGLVDWVTEYVEPIRIRLELFSHGVDVASYNKFAAMIPNTYVDHKGAVCQYWVKSTRTHSRDDARFCYNFAVDSALALRDIQIPDGTDPNRSRLKARVTHSCELLVHPDADPPEVIRVVKANEEVLITNLPQHNLRASNSEEYVPILQDGDVAYIRRNCLETVPESDSS